MTSTFFERRPDWIHYKHELLRKYLKPWTWKLSKRCSELAFIDTCAGEGLYGDGNAGSPLIAVRFNEDKVLQRKKCRLVVHAVEDNPTRAQRLSEVLRKWCEREPPCAFIYNESFEKALPALLERTRHVPTLVFIDPWGVRNLTADKLRPLLKDRARAPTEVLVRVDPTLFARFSGWLKDGENRDARWRKTADSFRRLLNELTINPEIAKQIRHQEPGKGARILRLFQAYLQMFMDRFAWVQIIPVRATYFAAPRYYLVHGTDSPHGAAKLNDVVSKTEDELFEHSEAQQDGPQMRLLSSERETDRHLQPRVRPEETVEYITDLLKRRGPLEFIELRAELALRYGPDLREKHHKSVLSGLIRDGVVNISPPGKITDRAIVQLASRQ